MFQLRVYTLHGEKETTNVHSQIKVSAVDVNKLSYCTTVYEVLVTEKSICTQGIGKINYRCLLK